jgi:hypothetical protein
VTVHGKRYAISDGDRAGDPYLLSCKLVESLVISVNSTISYNPTSVPMFYVLITYSCQHDILIPTYMGMSSLYQVLNFVCSYKPIGPSALIIV